MWSAVAVALETGAVSLSRVLTEAGVAPAVHLRGPAPSAASPTQNAGESGKGHRTRSVQLGVESGHPHPYPVHGWTLRCILMRQQLAPQLGAADKLEAPRNSG